MTKLLLFISDILKSVGKARAAAHMCRIGRDDLAKQIMLDQHK